MEEEILDPQPVHTFFELSYASWLVLPRVALQSMPVEWQRQFVSMVEQISDSLPEFSEMEPAQYTVQCRGNDGKITANKFPNYRHNSLTLKTQ